jgi:hypothetical protein
LASTTGREQLTAAPSASASSCAIDVVFLLDAPADGDQDGVLGDIDIARFCNDRLQIAPARGQRTNIQ